MLPSAELSESLIDAATLAGRLHDLGPAGPSLRLCELRWTPTGPRPRARYDQGHLPGACFVDLDRDLSRAQAGGPGGRHPLPSPEELARVLSRLGIGPSTEVVVYDDGPGTIAARFWFLLRLHGHARVRLLDGGLTAWTASGRPLSTEEPPIAPVEERALIRDGRLLVDRATVAGWVAAPDQRPLLLDVRAPERYRGEVEPLDARAGHIPGATNLPTASLVRSPADPRLLPPAELRAVLERAGAASGRDLVFSCGSGITACLGLLALEQAGLSPASAPARLYAGSFSDWISGEGAPVAVGSDPG